MKSLTQKHLIIQSIKLSIVSLVFGNISKATERHQLGRQFYFIYI